MSKAYRRVKWMGFVLLLFLAVSYFGTHLSTNMNDYIAFVEAEEDFIINKSPGADLDENGKIATAKFES